MIKNRKKSRSFRIGQCPKCYGFIYEDNHIHCIMSYTKEILSDEIKKIITESDYYDIYQKMMPPLDIHQINNLGVILDMKYYDLSWRILWQEEFRSYTLIPHLNVIKILRNIIGNDLVLEIGAGSGLYAAILKQFGFNIVATDSYEEFETSILCKYNGIFKYTNVEKMEASIAIKEYHANVLLSIWNENIPDKDSIKTFNGNKIIIIGSNDCFRKNGGIFNTMCAESSGKQLIDKNYDVYQNWICKEMIQIQSWNGIDEYLFYIERI